MCVLSRMIHTFHILYFRLIPSLFITLVNLIKETYEWSEYEDEFRIAYSLYFNLTNRSRFLCVLRLHHQLRRFASRYRQRNPPRPAEQSSAVCRDTVRGNFLPPSHRKVVRRLPRRRFFRLLIHYSILLFSLFSYINFMNRKFFAAEALGMPFVQPVFGGKNLSGGADFAVGGSTALPDTFFLRRRNYEG